MTLNTYSHALNTYSLTLHTYSLTLHSCCIGAHTPTAAFVGHFQKQNKKVCNLGHIHILQICFLLLHDIRMMSHVPYEWVMSHMNESCLIWDMTHSYGTWLIILISWRSRPLYSANLCILPQDTTHVFSHLTYILAGVTLSTIGCCALGWQLDILTYSTNIFVRSPNRVYSRIPHMYSHTLHSCSTSAPTNIRRVSETAIFSTPRQ